MGNIVVATCQCGFVKAAMTGRGFADVPELHLAYSKDGSDVVSVTLDEAMEEKLVLISQPSLGELQKLAKSDEELKQLMCEASMDSNGWQMCPRCKRHTLSIETTNGIWD